MVLNDCNGLLLDNSWTWTCDQIEHKQKVIRCQSKVTRAALMTVKYVPIAAFGCYYDRHLM